jgi:hypothetical protein
LNLRALSLTFTREDVLVAVRYARPDGPYLGGTKARATEVQDLARQGLPLLPPTPPQQRVSKGSFLKASPSAPVYFVAAGSIKDGANEQPMSSYV